MNEVELRAVIEGPPKALGASVDPKLTEKLIRDIGLDPASGRSDEYDIGKLPLLEYALEQAWAKRTGPRIGLENYSGLEQALEERANTLFDRLSAEEQAAAKRLFVSLVTPGEGREDTRARIDMPNDDAMRRVVQTFAGDARLVVTDKFGGRRSVEVSHEALIRHWDKLRTWIDENRDKLRTREFLRAQRAEWLKRSCDPGLLELPRQYVEAAQTLYLDPGDLVIDDIKDYVDALVAHEWQGVADKKSARRRTVRWRALGIIALTALVWFGSLFGAARGGRADKIGQMLNFADLSPLSGFRLPILLSMSALDQANGQWWWFLDSGRAKEVLAKRLVHAPRFGGTFAATGFDPKSERIALLDENGRVTVCSLSSLQECSVSDPLPQIVGDEFQPKSRNIAAVGTQNPSASLRGSKLRWLSVPGLSTTSSTARGSI